MKRMTPMILGGFVFFLYLHSTLSLGIAQDKPKASVIVNKGTIPHFDELNKMAKCLNTSVLKTPDKARFLRALPQSDIIYINTHLSLVKNSILVDDPALPGRANRDGVTQKEVRQALQDYSPKLVVLVGCAGNPSHWSHAFDPATVIDFSKSIVGMAGDVYFSLFFEAWTKKPITLHEALAHADQKALERQGRSVTEKLLMEDLKAVITHRILHGDGQRRYLERIWQSGNWEETNLNTGKKRIIFLKHQGPPITATIGKYHFSGYEKDRELILTFKFQTLNDINVLEGPIPEKVKQRILEEKIENRCRMEIHSATEMVGTCMESWTIEWDKDEELINYSPKTVHPVIWKKVP